MNIYKELDQIIDEYVGVEPVEQYMFNAKGEMETETVAYVSLDPHLRDEIGKECTLHINKNVDIKKLSKDAQVCIYQWEQLLKEAVDGRDHRSDY